MTKATYHTLHIDDTKGTIIVGYIGDEYSCPNKDKNNKTTLKE